MKNPYYTLAMVLLAVVTLFTASCNKTPADKSTSKSIVNSNVAPDNFNYTGSLYKGNYVWGGAMNLAWNDLTENIVKDKIGLDTTDSLALETLYKLNNPVITKTDLDEQSYYIKSGFGQKTVDVINKECRNKFPGKTFADLDEKLGDKDIIAYAYFLKTVEYSKQFTKSSVSFNGTLVKGFKSIDNSRDNIDIIDYQDEDYFLVRIRLKDAKDQLFVAKGYPMNKPDSVIAFLRKKAPHSSDKNRWFGQRMKAVDFFSIPMLKLYYHRDYNEMMGKDFNNKINNYDYFIGIMYENIRFNMDEKGARVENEGVVSVLTAIEMPKNKTKTMILDKPFWLLMKRFDSENPYFILGVNNTELMQKAD
jgi:hypothetical protein